MSFIDDVRWMKEYGITKKDVYDLWDHPMTRRSSGGTHPAILYLEDVEVTFSGFKALDIKTFFVNRGELRFLIGPNGAGKTTLLDVICRKTEAKKGKILYDGFCNLKEFDIPGIARLGISRKFQTPSVFSALTVRQNMDLAYPKARSVFQGLRYRKSEEAEKEIGKTLELIGLDKYAELPAVNLSHGQKQWLEIGLTLLQKPRLLMVDEPVAGMTEKERYATGILLQEIARDCAVLVVEHDMHFVKNFAKSVSVLHEGKILCEGSFDYVSKDPQVIDVYLGRGGAEEKEAVHA